MAFPPAKPVYGAVDVPPAPPIPAINPLLMIVKPPGKLPVVNAGVPVEVE
jgi:hypothetical protein